MRRVAGVATLAAGAWTLAHRRSRAVRTWQRPEAPVREHGSLRYRATGPEDAEAGVLLLHGLVATGDVFGATPSLLGQRHRVIVPDLLGFGRSLDEGGTDFSSEAHLRAIDDLVAHELGSRRIRVGAHSMGSALALRWAAADPARVDRVVCVAPPAYPDADTAARALGELGPMGRSLVLDDRLARAVCDLNCRHRTVAGLVSALAAPRWPIPIARQASLHTWAAYIAAVEEQIIDCPWSDLVDRLVDHRVPVRLVRGRRDVVGDTEFLRTLGGRPGIDFTVVDGDHTLPAAEPGLLADALW